MGMYEVHKFVPLHPDAEQPEDACKFCPFPEKAAVHSETARALTEAEVESHNLVSAIGVRVEGGIFIRGDTEFEEPRISREALFLEIVQAVRKRSSCLRGKVGVVIVRDARIISMGYNGAPPGAPHCYELGCDVDENVHDAGCERAIHAEANAIAWAARHGISTDGCTMYSTHSPCLKCAQLIVSAGINHVVYINTYRLERLDILDASGVKHTNMGPA